MRYCLFLLTLAGFLAFASLSLASTSTSWTHQLIGTTRNIQQPGRDFWFTMAQNYDAGGGVDKSYILYVSSRTKTTVNIAVRTGSVETFSITAGQIVTFNIPIAWEVTSSGVVEDKGIHVWSTDADLSVYLLSRNPASSDGMYVIPTVGWGNENVVASYTSLFELTFDYPSEFSVIAAVDNTTAVIMPSWDIRASHQSTVVLHPRDTAFTETFKQGQCAQYQLTQAQNSTDYDVTGSVVRANVPVGVVAGSQCPNIPADYTYCDHICDMMPPVRTWGANYYSLPFINRKGGDTFRAIASADSQTIYHTTASGTAAIQIDTKFGYWTDPTIDKPGHWYSNKPFMLVQYINSTGWPDGGKLNDGIGDPAMVVLCPNEEFTTSYQFQTPTTKNGSPYTNYINIFVPAKAASSTYLDDVLIDSTPSIQTFSIDSIKGYLAVRARPGAHTLRSTAPVGGYVYGYGAYDSYAWSISLGTNTLHSGDTIAPIFRDSTSTIDTCSCAHLIVSDVALSEVIFDSLSNMTYSPDPAYHAGMGAQSTFYELCPADPTRPGFALVSAYDATGNRSQIKSVYTPPELSLSLTRIDFADSVAIIKLYNQSGRSYGIRTHLVGGSKGFTLRSDSAFIDARDSATISIAYNLQQSVPGFDTLSLFIDNCHIYKVALAGGIVHVDISHRADSCTRVKDTTVIDAAVSNASISTITIVGIEIADGHFSLRSPLPLIVPRGQSVPLQFGFVPLDSVAYTSQVNLITAGGDTLQLTLKDCGKGVTSGVTIQPIQNTAVDKWLRFEDPSQTLLLAAYPNPADRVTAERVTFTVGARQRGPISLKLYDQLGREVATIANSLWHEEGVSTYSWDASKLALGTYIYRFEAMGQVKSGKLVIEP